MDSCHTLGAWVVSHHHYLNALDEFQWQSSLDTAHGGLSNVHVAPQPGMMSSLSKA